MPGTVSRRESADTHSCVWWLRFAYNPSPYDQGPHDAGPFDLSPAKQELPKRVCYSAVGYLPGPVRLTARRTVC